MSRIGKKPVPIPQGVTVDIDGHTVRVKGPKGELVRTFHPDMAIERQDGALVVRRPSEDGLHRSLHGLTRTLLANMVEGVTQGFSKTLEISGVGYRAVKEGKTLVLSVGYSHPVRIDPPDGINILVEGTNRIVVQGIDKELVGEVAARIRAVRPPDPYKGKGIMYAGERLRRKAGKAGKAGGKK